MDLIKGILTRRSIGKVKSDPVPHELIEEVLHAGIHAPNHYRTEPWKFFVLEGDARKRLGLLFEKIEDEQIQEENLDVKSKKLERAKKNPLRAPVIIAVAVEPHSQRNVISIEEYAAVHSAVQNMLLAAHYFGLGAIWRTGPLCYHPKVKDFFQLSQNGDLVAFIYLGYPDMNPPSVTKTSFESFTTWLN
ncbi:nitroreductase family protein [Halalkalibacter krulwichiae]|uniref:Putative NAD(P)H nitroreductase n=1 Tax=Halalkalibacter krulwichiae TaxID=199441 RepID=A0A1X9MAV1_9BACI|nr:nitroreductase [Halalkalibacter krulwichiae]ARK30575.1 Putative NAD(P)H nitroreductase YdjA [Halalkalibacter krulwichiae]